MPCPSGPFSRVTAASDQLLLSSFQHLLHLPASPASSTFSPRFMSHLVKPQKPYVSWVPSTATTAATPTHTSANTSVHTPQNAATTQTGTVSSASSVCACLGFPTSPSLPLSEPNNPCPSPFSTWVLFSLPDDLFPCQCCYFKGSNATLCLLSRNGKRDAALATSSSSLTQ